MRESARMMLDNQVGAVAVVEDGVLVGMLSERDLMGQVTDREVDIDRQKAGDVMTRDPVTIGSDAKRGAALKLMLTSHCHHLPVTDDGGRVLGMLSVRHLFRERLRRLRGQMDSLASYMAADGPGG